MALADFSEVIRLDPKYSYARYTRGMIYYRKDEYAKALSDFDEVIRLAPDSPASASAYEKRATILSGCPDQRLWDRRLAAESASKACELTGWKDVDCLLTLAVAHANVQEFDPAIAAIDKAIALLKPGDKRIENYQSMRDSFRASSLIKLGPGEIFPN